MPCSRARIMQSSRCRPKISNRDVRVASTSRAPSWRVPFTLTRILLAVSQDAIAPSHLSLARQPHADRGALRVKYRQFWHQPLPEQLSVPPEQASVQVAPRTPCTRDSMHQDSLAFRLQSSKRHYHTWERADVTGNVRSAYMHDDIGGGTCVPSCHKQI
jgi:hypothetical protein